MTLQEYLKNVKQRAEAADKAICDVAANPNKFKMCVPPEKDDTDVLITDLANKDVPALLKMVDFLHERLSCLHKTGDEYTQNTARICLHQISSLIPDAEVQG